jgi:hypothetical protein
VRKIKKLSLAILLAIATATSVASYAQDASKDAKKRKLTRVVKWHAVRLALVAKASHVN